MVRTALLALLVLAAGPAGAQAPRPATVADLRSAERLAQEGRGADALALYRLIGENAATRDLRATGWLRAGRLVGEASVAETHFRRAAELDTTGQPGAEALLELGQLHFARGAYRNADQDLARCQLRLKSTALAPTVTLFRARVAMALHDPRDAAEAFQDLARRGPLAQQGLYGLAQAMQVGGPAASALECYDRYASAYPAGDFLGGALAGAARTGERAGKPDRAAAARARLALVAPASFEAQDLPAARGRVAQARPAPTPVVAAAPKEKDKPAPAATRDKPVAPAPKPKPPVVAAAKDRPAATTAKDRPQPAPARVKPAPVAEAPEAASAGEASGEGGCSIQLGLFASAANANALLKRVRAAGLEAGLDTVHGGSGVLYRVRGSHHASKDAAAQAAGRYRDAGFPTQLKQKGP